MVKVWTRRPLVDGKKECCKCKRMLDVANFYKTKTGHEYSCKECRALTPEQKRNANLKKNYNGLTLEEYQIMHEAQGGVCASCGQPETFVNHGRVMPLAVDHCHTTNAIRGLLCAECNIALGNLHDSPERIQALLNYVNKYRTEM